VSAMVQGMIGDTCPVDSKGSQLVAPGHGHALILERSDRFPCVKPRVGNGHERVLGGSAQEAKTTNAHRAYLAAPPCLFTSTHGTEACRISRAAELKVGSDGARLPLLPAVERLAVDASLLGPRMST
jgi:hypothetical protein